MECSFSQGMGSKETEHLENGVYQQGETTDEPNPAKVNGNGPSTDIALQIRTSYVIGCDGANSTVRRMEGFTTTDLGFENDWLIVDLVSASRGRPWSSTPLRFLPTFLTIAPIAPPERLHTAHRQEAGRLSDLRPEKTRDMRVQRERASTFRVHASSGGDQRGSHPGRIALEVVRTLWLHTGTQKSIPHLHFPLFL